MDSAQGSDFVPFLEISAKAKKKSEIKAPLEMNMNEIFQRGFYPFVE